MDKMDGLSLNLEKQNIQRIKELFPEAVEEGKINFDMLRAMLGDEVDDSREKYQFTWNGKAKSIKMAQTPSSATLRPCKDKSKNWNTTENFYIEGDNLEVLKQLQKTYYGKIKMIYIDPPYNTSNDFIYNDSFSDSIENYKEQTNQVLSSNPENGGRFHTKWLNMIYPRLILARNLMSSDGVIFISIDDNELENLKKICNEIFGESNFIGLIARATGTTTGQDANKIGSSLDYCIAYSKSDEFILKGIDLDENDLKRFNESDENGRYSVLQLRKTGNADRKEDRPNMFYAVKAPDGTDVYPFGPGGYLSRWRVSHDSYNELLQENKIVWKKNESTVSMNVEGYEKSEWVPYVKYYLEGRTKKISNLLQNIEGNKKASLILKDLLGTKGVFDNPKPLEFLEILLQIATDSDSIVLDFFSGSGTTSHAIMKYNKSKATNLKFILVQLPEVCDQKSSAYNAGYKNICEIGEKRIHLAGEEIKANWEKEHPSDGLFGPDEEFKTDIGFKVFKLDSTNVNEWDPNMKLDEKELAMRLGEVFKEGRSKEDILYEIMLKYGVFDKQVEQINVNGKTMYRVGKRYMIVCLEDSITLEDVKGIGELSPRTVIFNEAGFNNDNDKINAVYNLEKAGVEDVKCI